MNLKPTALRLSGGLSHAGIIQRSSCSSPFLRVLRGKKIVAKLLRRLLQWLMRRGVQKPIGISRGHVQDFANAIEKRFGIEGFDNEIDRSSDRRAESVD